MEKRRHILPYAKFMYSTMVPSVGSGTKVISDETRSDNNSSSELPYLSNPNSDLLIRKPHPYVSLRRIGSLAHIASFHIVLSSFFTDQPLSY